jgi:hypothetical protein
MNTDTNLFDAFYREGLYSSLLYAKVIDHHGSVRQERCQLAPHFDLLDKEEHKAIESEYKTSHPVISRDLQVGEISASEVATITHNAARSVIKTRLTGGRLRSLVRGTIVRIFKTVSGQQVLVEAIATLQKTSKDRDWSLLIKDCNNLGEIIEKGLVSLISDKVKQADVNRCHIAVATAIAHQKALRAPPGSYSYKSAKKHGKIVHARDPDLIRKFVELCVFEKVADGVEPGCSKQFFLRRIGHGSGIQPDDYGFTNEEFFPARPIDSLYVQIDTYPQEGRLKLASTLGKAGLIQAVFDLILNNMTFDPTKAVAGVDFARTVLFFTEGGTCLQSGWIEKTFTELCAFAKKIKWHWPQLLAHQLISLCQNHGEHSLVTLAFNASALLTWKKCASASEIELIWTIIFWHKDKTEPQAAFQGVFQGVFQEQENLIPAMEICLRGKDCRFEDVYFQIQATSMMCLNRWGCCGNNLHCSLSLTEQHPFIRIQLRTKQSSHLFFPREPTRAIDHLTSLQVAICHPNNQRARTALATLRNVHTIMSGKELFLCGFGQSCFAPCADDPRFERDRALKQITTLLHSPEEYTWSIGFYLALALLAERADVDLLFHLSKSVLSMLVSGVPERLKNEVMGRFTFSLNQSGIQFDHSLLQRFMPLRLHNLSELPSEDLNTLAKYCVTINHPSFTRLATHLPELIASPPSQMFRKLAQESTDQKDFLSAFTWLSAEQKQTTSLSLDFCKYSFAVAIEAIKNFVIRPACAFLAGLALPTSFPSEWLSVFELLLQRGEEGEVLYFLYNDKSLLPSLSLVQNQERIDTFLNEMKKSAVKLQSTDIHINNSQCEQLLQVMYPFLSSDWYNGAPLWIEYMELLVRGLSLPQTEEFFRSMMKDKLVFRRIPNSTERITFFWIPLFTKFGEEGSKILLDVTLWKESLQEEIMSKMLWKHIGKLYRSIAKGASECLKAMEHGIDKKKKAKDVLGVFSMQHCISEVVGTTGTFFLDLAELNCMLNEKESLYEACMHLQGIFWLSNPSALVESRAVQLAAEVVSKMMMVKDPEQSNNLLMLIDLVQRSAFRSKGDHFTFLKFVMNHLDCYRDVPSQAKTYFLLNMLSSLLESILSPCAGGLPHTISEEKITLVTQGMKFINDHSGLYQEFFQWCVQQPAFRRYVRESTRKAIAAKPFRTPNRPEFLILRIRKNAAILQVMDIRQKAARKLGFSYRAEYLPVEQQAMQSLKKDLSTLCIRAAVVTVFAIGFFYWLSSVVVGNKQ